MARQTPQPSKVYFTPEPLPVPAPKAPPRQSYGDRALALMAETYCRIADAWHVLVGHKEAFSSDELNDYWWS